MPLRCVPRTPSRKRRRATLDEVATFLSEDLGVGFLDHTDAGAAVVGDHIERDAPFDGCGNVAVAQGVETAVWRKSRVLQRLLDGPRLVGALPSLPSLLTNRYSSAARPVASRAKEVRRTGLQNDRSRPGLSDIYPKRFRARIKVGNARLR